MVDFCFDLMKNSILAHSIDNLIHRSVIAERNYVATRKGPDAFKQPLHAEALLSGMAEAETVLVAADGAVWMETSAPKWLILVFSFNKELGIQNKEWQDSSGVGLFE